MKKSGKNLISFLNAKSGLKNHSDVWAAGLVLMFVRPVPVLIFRMKHMGKKAQGSDAGIPAAFHISPFILPDIIHAGCSQQDGDKGLCINFRTCRKGCLFMSAPVVAVVPGHVRLI